MTLGLVTGVAGHGEVDNPLVPPDTSSPRATLTTFREHVHAAYRIVKSTREAFFESGDLIASEALARQAKPAERIIEHAIGCLDLSEVPPRLRADAGIEATLRLKEILDRIELPPMDSVPGATEIEALGLGPQEPFHWRIPGTELRIARVTEGPRVGEFLFSPDTVRRIRSDYLKIRRFAYRDGASEGFYSLYSRLPGRIVSPRWLTWVGHLPSWAVTLYAGQTVWQWVGLVLTVLMAVSAVMMVHRWARRFRPVDPGIRLLRGLASPVTAIIVTFVAIVFIDEQLSISGNVLSVLAVLATSAKYLIGVWVSMVAGIGVAEWIISSPHIAPKGLDASLIRLLFRVAAVCAAAFLIGAGARQIGVPLTAVIAGLGVGGLAVGLAARPTVENIIGSFSLFADRPVTVGDFCQYGDRQGWVEEIGLRSTRIRGRDCTVTTIPNADFASIQITNFTRRDRILLRTTLGLRYETSADQLRFVLAKLREMLLAHPRFARDTMRVRFVGFGEFSLNLEVYAHAKTSSMPEFLAIQEDVLLRIMNIVDEAGTGFAFPSSTTYLTRDRGIETARGEGVEAQVQAWRAAGTLPFPEFAADHSEEISDTLDYPPEGSPGSRRSKEE